jgi:hypothetical protein
LKGRFILRQIVFTRVGTYVQRGSKFCFVVLVVLVGVTDIAQNTALLSNFTMLSAYCTIASTFARQYCPAALPGSLARQPCPAALSCSLVRQPCPAALTASLPGSFAWQPCPGSLTRQPCSAVRPISTAFDALARSLARSLAMQSLHCATVASHQTACARCCPDRLKLVFSPISPCFHYLHARAAVLQTGLNLFSCSYEDIINAQFICSNSNVYLYIGMSI